MNLKDHMLNSFFVESKLSKEEKKERLGLINIICDNMKEGKRSLYTYFIISSVNYNFFVEEGFSITTTKPGGVNIISWLTNSN